MATDGIWDNLFVEDIKACVQPRVTTTSGYLHNLQATSDCISTLSEFKSYDPKYESPFYVEGKKDKDAKEELGGKQDDITVIVS